MFLADDRLHAPLMRRLGIRVQQAHTDRLDLVVAEESRGCAHACFVEWAQLPPEKVEASADLAHEPQRHDAVRLHPEIRVAVALRHGLAGDLQDVAESLRNDQSEASHFTLEQ